MHLQQLWLHSLLFQVLLIQAIISIWLPLQLFFLSTLVIPFSFFLLLKQELVSLIQPVF